MITSGVASGGLLWVPVAAPPPLRPAVPDLEAAVRRAVVQLVDSAGPRLGPGKRVAIPVGSRDPAGLLAVLRALVGLLRERGAEPLLVPAMGSHGGGTYEGQRAVLAGLGVTSEAVGAPFAAPDSASGAGGAGGAGGSAVFCGRTAAGRRIFCVPAALAADAVVVFNRVKSHTAFDGRVQSGLLKMIAVGLGGPEGAAEIHRAGAAGIEAAIFDVAQALTRILPLAGGLAAVQNALGDLASLEATEEGSWAGLSATDAGYLALSRSIEGRLPADDLDLLVVDRMGKDIVGTGMDPRVIGRRRVWDYPEPETPNVRRLVVLRLTAAAHGNANGIGLADFTTRRLAQAIDWPSTMKNVLTTTFTQRAALPPVFGTDREAVEAALATLPQPALATPSKPTPAACIRAIRIRDTAHLGQVLVSTALAREVSSGGWTVAGEPGPLPFGPDGNLNDIG